MIIHWWMMATFVETFFSPTGTMRLLSALAVIFPLVLGCSVCFAAGKIDRRLLVPSGFGLLSVPLAATLYCIVNGLKIRFVRY
jgi:hypothetical protein